MEKIPFVIVQKNGDLKEGVLPLEESLLYKKCGYKNPVGFEKQTTWKCRINGKMTNVILYAKITGRSGSENKYDFPPPVDNILYFGSCCLVAKNGEKYSSLTIDLWKTIYETLFGGFEDLKNTEKEDEEEEDELVNVDPSLKTEDGYLKDGFVVSDDDLINYDSELSEEEYE
uniref:Uncharacterized protein n=1 Tax=viral metagenome TaxID=1070528 RepID=A0A6C0HS87_9ZZZZ